MSGQQAELARVPAGGRPRAPRWAILFGTTLTVIVAVFLILELTVV